MSAIDRLRTVVNDLPFLHPVLEGYRAIRRRYRDLRPTAAPFTDIYRSNLWGASESASGHGSTMSETEAIRGYLPDLLRRLQVRTLLDIPCGDFHWIRTIDLDVDEYIGADIVPELVASLQERYGTERRQFRVLDATSDPLPKVDAILNRHCLIHLSNRRAAAALDNFRRSGARWLLTTSYTDCDRNVDIETGSFRPVNLRLAPFNLPAPVESLPDTAWETARLDVYDLHAWGRRPG